MPNTLWGPDLIIGGQGRLVCLFYPAQEEFNHPHRLLWRLISTRLGTPSHAKSVLVVEARHSGLGTVGQDFHAVIEAPHQIRDLPVILTDAALGPHIRDVPPNTRQWVGTRAAHLLTVSMQSFSKSRTVYDTLQSPPALHTLAAVDGAAEARHPDHHLIRYKNSVYTADEPAPQSGSLKTRLSRYILPAFEEGFWVDNGTPYVKKPTANVLVTPQLGPSVREGTLRAASYSGWAAVIRDSDLDFVLDQLEGWTRRGFRGGR